MSTEFKLYPHPERECRKCGRTVPVKLRYHEPHDWITIVDANGFCKGPKHTEHLYVECQCCLYSWAEETNDNKLSNNI